MSSSSSSSKSHLHVDTTTTITTGSAASSGSASSSHSSRSPRPSSSSAAAAAASGQQNQACAACKYQRRKCNPDCPLAPYFPADQQRRFLNAHRLFGVSNIQKTLRRIDPELGPEAMRALIFQADARAADPVGGCVAIIERIQREVERTELELAYVKQQISIYRQAAATADPAMVMLQPATSGGGAGDVAGQDGNAVAMDALYAAGQELPGPAGGTGLVFHQGQQGQGYHVVNVGDQQKQPPAPQLFYNYFGYDGTAGDEATSSHEHSVHGQYGFADNNNVRIGSPVALGEQLEQHCQIEAAPFVDKFDVKPQGMLATVEHHGVVHREEKLKLGAVLKHDDVDQQMEEPATGAAAPCHLELGFSSF